MRYILFILATILFAIPTFAQQNGQQQADQAKAHLTLYPKTADTYVNVYVECPKITDITITIPASSKNGELNIPLNSRADYQHKIDVSHMPNGTYTVQVKGADIDLKKTFVIKRKSN